MKVRTSVAAFALLTTLAWAAGQCTITQPYHCTECGLNYGTSSYEQHPNTAYPNCNGGHIHTLTPTIDCICKKCEGDD